jgi:hypothetical protein
VRQYHRAVPDDVPSFIPPKPPHERPPRTEPLRASRPAEPEPVLDGVDAPIVTKRSLLDGLGPRVDRRPEARLGISLAGAGAAIIVVGVLSLGGDQLVGSGGSGSQAPGALLTLAVIAIGVALIAKFHHGPMAAAGVAASAIALPAFLFFVTFSKNTAPPFDTILLLATLGWLAGYTLGPGRGHNFYLGAALVGLWLWFIEVTEHVFSFPLGFLTGLARVSNTGSIGSISDSGLGLGGGPDASTVGTYSLIFAAGYLVIAALLDRRGRLGAGTPFAFAGIVTLVLGISFLSNDLEQFGTGLAFVVAGLVLAYVGATGGRRATNWIGGILVFAGVTTIVSNWFTDATPFGLAEIVVGAALIVGAQWLTTTFREPPETEVVLSRFYRVGSTQPSGPPPPPAGSVLG